MRLCANRIDPASAILIAGLLLLLNGAALGDSEHLREETWNSGWSFHLDNDFLALLNEDQQYTGGASVELSGLRARDWGFSADPLLSWIDRLSGIESRMVSGDGIRHSIILGLAAFTPQDIEIPEPIFDDHPYGSLILFGNSRQSVDSSRNVAYKSSLVLGLLGTRIAKTLQNFFHDLIDTEKAQGWHNQISDGGELTGRYELSRHKLLQSTPLPGNRRLESRWKVSASAGYVTQVGVGATARWGKFDEEWFRFDPAPGEYVAYGAPTIESQPSSRGREWFFWTSVEANLRLYNALLQGQFRDSAVTFSRGELRELITEASVGMTTDLFKTGLRADFSVSYRISEIKGSLADDALWGRISLSRSF